MGSNNSEPGAAFMAVNGHYNRHYPVAMAPATLACKYCQGAGYRHGVEPGALVACACNPVGRLAEASARVRAARTALYSAVAHCMCVLCEQGATCEVGATDASAAPASKPALDTGAGPDSGAWAGAL